MMGLSRVSALIRPNWHKVKAQEAFQMAAVAIAESLTEDHLHYMGQNDVRLSAFLNDLGMDSDALAGGDDPAIKHLLACTDDFLLALLDEVLPEKTAVIRQYPVFAHHMMVDLRGAIGGLGPANG